MKAALVMSVGLFVLACFLPALRFKDSNEVWTGWQAMVLGIEVGWRMFNFAAYANFVWLFSLWAFYAKRVQWAWVASLIALVMTLETFQLAFLKEMKFAGMDLGFFAWMGSFAVMAVASWRLRRAYR